MDLKGNIDLKEAYQDKMKAQLEKLDARIDLLRAEAKEAQADTKIEINDRVEALEEQRDEDQKRLDNVKGSGAAAWRDLKSGADTAMSELENAVESALSKFK